MGIKINLELNIRDSKEQKNPRYPYNYTLDQVGTTSRTFIKARNEITTKLKEAQQMLDYKKPILIKSFQYYLEWCLSPANERPKPLTPDQDINSTSKQRPQ